MTGLSREYTLIKIGCSRFIMSHKLECQNGASYIWTRYENKRLWRYLDLLQFTFLQFKVYYLEEWFFKETFFKVIRIKFVIIQLIMNTK